jgi:hypothetical protein
MRKKRMWKDEKREVTLEFVNMSKEILYPQIQGVTETWCFGCGKTPEGATSLLLPTRGHSSSPRF